MGPTGLFAGLTTLDLVQRVSRMPGADEKVVAQCSDLAAGGPAATAAVTFAALGGRAVLLSALGPGPVARLAAADLDGTGVRVVDAWAGGADVSISAITVLDGTGERSVVSRNAEEVRAAPPVEIDALVDEADVVLLDGHHPALATAVADAAGHREVPVVLDCGSAKPVYARLLALADVAVCSAGFTYGAVTGCAGAGAGGFDALAAAVLAEGTRLVAVTDGAGPVRWRTPREAGAVPVPPVEVRDTLGAGDVLHGAVAFARARRVRDPRAVLAFGVAVASLRVQYAGPRAWLADQRLAGLVPGR